MSQVFDMVCDDCDVLEAARGGNVTSVTSVTTRARAYTCARITYFYFLM